MVSSFLKIFHFSYTTLWLGRLSVQLKGNQYCKQQEDIIKITVFIPVLNVDLNCNSHLNYQEITQMYSSPLAFLSRMAPAAHKGQCAKRCHY